MPLIDRLEEALDAGVDPDKFERAAVALLQSRYPWLSPVEAGSDLGRDADIYRVVPDDPASRGRVLATTGDPLKNLKSSHKSWQKETSFRVDAIVIACSRDITGITRKKIDRYCQDHNLPLPEYYGRDWLVEVLINRPEWRETLTGVRGRIEALREVSRPRAERATPLVGRAEVLSSLNTALLQGIDVMLCGIPGVGKTRLIEEVDAAANLRLVEPAGKDHLADDLLANRPHCVAVDDAHLHVDVLRETARLRAQEGLTFAIVACTWPDDQSAVASALPGHVRVDVDRLSRSELDALIQAAGVNGVRARHLILDQADGRPGWAMSLSSALVEGSGSRVASGDELLDQVERYLRAAADSATTLDAVACIAALNGASHDDLESISRLVGAPSAGLVEAIQRVATSGLVERLSGQWHLQPALRNPLVSRWFFGPAQRRSWKSLSATFATRWHDLTTTLLGAAAGSSNPELVNAARAWARSLDPPQQWDEETLELARLYAAVDESAAEFAAGAARLRLASERPSVENAVG